MPPIENEDPPASATRNLNIHFCCRTHTERSLITTEHASLIIQHNALCFSQRAASFVLIFERARPKQTPPDWAKSLGKRKYSAWHGRTISAMLITIIAPSSDISLARAGAAKEPAQLDCVQNCAANTENLLEGSVPTPRISLMAILVLVLSVVFAVSRCLFIAQLGRYRFELCHLHFFAFYGQ